MVMVWTADSAIITVTSLGLHPATSRFTIRIRGSLGAKLNQNILARHGSVHLQPSMQNWKISDHEIETPPELVEDKIHQVP